MDAKASQKRAWLSHVNHLNFGGHNHIAGTTDRLRRCQLGWPTGECHKLLTVGGNVDHIHRRDLYSAPIGRVEEMVFTARRSYANAVLRVVILSVCPSVRLSHACFVTSPKNLPAIFLYHMKGQSF